MTIVVTGATGQLGGLVVRNLLERVPAGRIAASVRDRGKAGELATLGVEIRHGDFAVPQTLPAAFAGAEKLLIISTVGDDEQRLALHRTAIAAAKEAGVGHIHYTSVTAADSTGIGVARVHRPTEVAIEETGIPYTFLRNNWYFQNDLGTIAGALATGAVATSSKGGRAASATREDYAEAAAAVLATDGHENAVYELGSPVAYSYADWAEAISAATGKPIDYVEISDEEAHAGLSAAGLPASLVEVIVDYYQSLSRGELDVPSDDLRRLIGHEPTTLAEFVARIVQS